jgi:mannosyltransferase
MPLRLWSLRLVALSFRRFWLPLCLFIVIGAALWLRINRLTVNPFWLDEAYSAFGADQGYRFIWTILPSYETHPPFYSTILRTWTLLTSGSILGFRSLGAFVGLITLPLIWLAGRELAYAIGRQQSALALPAAMLAAVTPSLVDMAKLVRPYSLMIFAYTIGLWSVLRLVRFYDEHGKISTGAWLGYLTSLILLVWLHNLGALYAGALGIALLTLVGPIKILQHHWRLYLVSHIIVLAAIIPAFIILLDQAPTWAKSTWLSFIPSALPHQIILIFGVPGLFGVAVAGLLIINGMITLKSEQRRFALALLIMAFLPILLSILISAMIAPVFLMRTLIACSVPFILLIALGVDNRLVVRATFAMLFMVTLIRAVQVQSLPPEQDWYAAVRWLAPKLRPGDLVYAYPNEGALPLRYALRDMNKSAEIRSIPSEVPARDPAGWYPTGSRGVQTLPAWRLEQIANDPVSRKAPTIWLLRMGREKYDPGDTSLHIFERNRVALGSYGDPVIDIIGLRQSPQITPREQTQP